MDSEFKWKMIYGYCLLGCTAALAGIIALGNVKSDSSFGLPQILGGLLVLDGAWAQWSFGENKGKGQGQGQGQKDKDE
jgi:hypothetical protein